MTRKTQSYKDQMAALNAEDDPVVINPRPRTSTSSGAVAFAKDIIGRDKAIKRSEELEAKLQKTEEKILRAQQEGGIVEISISDLHEEQCRRTNLDDEQYKTLLENLRHNNLVTPIIVRHRKSGGFEIISGHNRTQAFKDLGREKIPAVIADISDNDANKDAFFANLIHSSLPDYEKYLGFKNMLSDNPALTHEELAKISGLSTSAVTILLAFDRLPDQAHALIQQHPRLVGANSARDLALACSQGKAGRVIEALEMLSSGQLQTESKALSFVNQRVESLSKTNIAEERKFRKGKAVFCKYKRAANIVRIEFKSGDDAKSLENALFDLLETATKQ